jgi:hypothetical protein
MVQALVVTSSTVYRLKKAIEKGTPIVMLYHMNGCGHCQAMLPAWKLAKEEALKKNGDVLIAEVEYRNMGLLPLGMQGINGFPTIKAYVNEVIEYPGVHTGIPGDRSAASFFAFIMRYMKKIAVTRKPVHPVIKPLVKPAKRGAAGGGK